MRRQYAMPARFVRRAGATGSSNRTCPHPLPPLPSGEGELSASSESRPQESFEVFSAHVFVAYADDSIARGRQKLATCAVIALPSGSVVHASLELDDDAFPGTVKVDDEAVQHMLPAKLQTEYPSIAQQRPRMTLGGSRPMAQRSSQSESLRRSEATERIHRARMPARPLVEATRIPRRDNKRRGAGTLLASPLSRRERGTGGEDPKGEGDRG